MRGMTPEQTPAEILRAHVAICSDLHALFLEENRVLRTTSAPPSEELLARKREFLPRLDASLEQLRRVNQGSPRFTPEEQALVQEGRKKLMQLLMLDRENERLLLRASLPPQIKTAYGPVIPGKIAKAYGKYAPKGEMKA
jgi:hypothetical protein